ncbi:P45 [Goji berry chlorosis virus]|nr:P45 [Goji berry chlorosis virus]
MSSFQAFPSLPTPLAYNVSVHCTDYNVLSKLGVVGVDANRRYDYRIPAITGFIYINDQEYPYHCNAIVWAFPSGAEVSSKADIRCSKSVMHVNVKPGYSANPWTQNNLIPTMDWKVDAIANPLDEEDYAGKLETLGTIRKANEVRLSVIEEEIKSARAELSTLQGDPGRQKLDILNAQISILYKFLYPSGDKVDTFEQLSDIQHYKRSSIDLKPALSTILDKEVTDASVAIDEISKQVHSLEEKIRSSDPDGPYLMYLESKWKMLVDNHLPSKVFANTISNSALERIRDRLAALQLPVRDFASELEIVGYLSDYSNGLKDKLRNKHTATDPFVQLREDLLKERTQLTNELTTFVCDTSELNNQLIDLKRKRIIDQAKKDYINNPGFKGRNVKWERC